VLLVEDNEINQELALELLVSNGMTAEVANDGQEALDILAKQNFDGILMDCQMPVMDGYEATRKIRQQEKYKDLPILAMTANAMVGDREKVMEVGMNEHIAKPINLHDMFHTMAKWITPSNPQVAESEASGSAAEVSKKLELPDLEGIDTAMGLAITQGNTKLYIKLLTKFRESQRNFASLFQEALISDDPQAAERIAHTLKGTAATIGAEDVRAAAEVLEQACQQDDGNSGALLDELSSAVLTVLEPVVMALEKIEGATLPNKQVSVFNKVAAEPLLKQLKELLADDDASAVDIIDELMAMAKGDPIEETLTQMSNAIEDYDYDVALELFNKLGK
jgi:two-component system sensor histidine kinase/response regulator